MAVERQHRYATTVTWTGNSGKGTSGYRDYERSFEIDAAGKATIKCSADPAFRGDATLWNPEDLLVASLTACHKLWYLHLCSAAGVVVTAYEDHAEGVLTEGAGGGGHFTSVVLRPRVTITSSSDAARAMALHAEANALCFIANSVNFPVAHEAQIIAAPEI